MLALASHVSAQEGSSEMRDRPRLRDLGLKIGVYQLGRLNAITDVGGVRVGQVTIIQGDDVHTGVTVIVPHAGNMFQDKVAAAVYVYNAFGKLIGSTQVNELGELETPILLTNTLSVWDAAVALVDWMLALPGNEDVRSINPVVGETNDGWLNDIRGRHVKAPTWFAPWRARRAGPWQKARWARERAPWRWAGRAASVPARASFRRNSVDSPSACSCNRTSVGSLRWMACRYGASSGVCSAPPFPAPALVARA